ncbi:hypothetical protein BJ878DRAFT_269634 [Calycina marina]|uniref:Rhodopsin domain-containing protein n=1 Tax=Calycina marina TaxID=1763456 RepID=A0A9P8CH85_9HELO|nr:hypothetical protein BJ878DRAFT_269634 [Calycina marina]
MSLDTGLIDPKVLQGFLSNPNFTSILETFPVKPPPNGTVSNFIDPETNGHVLTIVSSIFLLIETLFFAGRIYSRAYIAHKVLWDDLTCTIGYILSLGFYILCVISVETSYYGYFFYDVSVAQIMNSDLFILGILQQIIYPLCMGFIKLTFFLFFWEIFSPQAWSRIAIWFGATMSTIFYVICVILHTVFSVPHDGQSLFIHSLSPDLKKDLLMGVPTAAITVAIDFYILAVPIFGLSALRLKASTKLGVYCIFLTGLMACLCSLLILYYRVQLLHASETLRVLPAVLTTSLLECQIGIACCCMPTIPMLFRKLRGRFEKPQEESSYYFIRGKRKLKMDRRRQSEYISFDEETTLATGGTGFTDEDVELREGIAGPELPKQSHSDEQHSIARPEPVQQRYSDEQLPSERLIMTERSPQLPQQQDFGSFEFNFLDSYDSMGPKTVPYPGT